jgi:protease IV
MKSFVQFIFASCLGFFLAMFVMVFLLFSMGISSLISSKDQLSDKSVLRLDMDYMLSEKTGNIEISPFDFKSGPNPGLTETLDLIGRAAQDSKISGLILRTSSSPNSLAVLDLLREAIGEFKDSGKFVYAYADGYSQTAYYLSTVADSLYINPSGMVDLRGFVSVIPFFKNMLDKIGVEMQVSYAGDYKSATEPFRRTSMSEENREQTREVLNDFVTGFVKNISMSRNINEDSIHHIMHSNGGRTAKRALASGLVDDVLYWDQMEDKLRTLIGIKENQRIKFVNLNQYKSFSKAPKKKKSKNKIAVLYAEGEIIQRDAKRGNINEVTYLNALKRIKRDKNIKAVVLRVNSPGGSANVSEMIWREMEVLKAKGIPVIASFGSLAASGGYYIAAGADEIITEPNTITGSIGVFMMLPNMQDLLNNKLGIHFDTVATHDYALGLNTLYEWNATDQKYLEEMTNEIYDLFKTRVADGRNLDFELVSELARGRIYSGRKAVEIGLADQLGTLSDAILSAAQKAGLGEDYKTVEYPTIKEDFFAEVMQSIAASDEETLNTIISNPQSRKLYELYRENKSLLNAQGVQARMPFSITWE